MVLGILIEIPRILSLAILGFVVALFTTLAQKFFTNQKLLKAIKDEMKELREQIKSTDDKDHAATLNKQVMDKSFKQMQQSMRSIFVTFIPLIFLFGWLNANLTYFGLEAGEFTTTVTFENGATGTIQLDSGELTLLSEATQAVADEVQWKLEGPPGEYTLEYIYGNEVYAMEVLLGDPHRYMDADFRKGGFLSFRETIPGESAINRIDIDLERVHPFGGFAVFGWMPGVLTAYIVFTIIASALLRKLLNVH